MTETCNVVNCCSCNSYSWDCSSVREKNLCKMQLQESLTRESVSLVLCRIQKHYTSLVLSSCSVHVDCLKTLSSIDCVFVGVSKAEDYVFEFPDAFTGGLWIPWWVARKPWKQLHCTAVSGWVFGSATELLCRMRTAHPGVPGCETCCSLSSVFLLMHTLSGSRWI